MFIEQQRHQLTFKNRIGLNILIVLSYLLVGSFAVFFTQHIASSSPMGFSNGLALALSLVFGLSNVFPGIVLGTLISSSLVSHSPIVILGLVGAKTFETYLAYMLLVAGENGKFRFKYLKDILYFILMAGVLSPFVSSTISFFFFYYEGVVHTSQFGPFWMNYFMGTVIGVIIFTPFILSFFNSEKSSLRPKRIEGFILYGILLSLTYWSSESQETRQYVLIPFLTWAALRFGYRGISGGALLVGVISVLRSTYFRGVYDVDPQKDLLWIQFLVAGISTVGYFLATVKLAHETVSEQEKELSINLQHKKVAEEALAILDQSLQNSPSGFALIDREYRFLRINKMLASISGNSTTNHLGKTIQEMMPENQDKILPLVKKVFTNGEALMNIPFRTKFSAGYISYYPIRHPGTNEIFSVAMSFQDITELLSIQNLLRENQDRMTFAQEVGKIGAFEWNLKQNRVLWTRELEHIYGLSYGEFGGFFESWLKLIHPDDVENTKKEFFKVIKGDQELNFQFRIITQERDTKWILARGKVVKDSDGIIEKLIGINIDLTEQKTYEQKLRLTEANLLHALSVRDEFVAIASHELKTPLQSLKLQLQMFQRAIERKDPYVYTPEKINSLLCKNSTQIDRLTRLVDDMLDISRIRTGKLTIKQEYCDLSVMLRDILGRTREQFEACGSGQPVITHFDHASGNWDQLRIEQVITNILTNAIRYGQGKPISVSVKNYQETVRITVTDQGQGIPKADHQRIFERYERGLIRREVSGLGLGLFITREIVEAHQGRIWVESDLNQGATFFVDLPRRLEDEKTLKNLSETENYQY